LAIFIIQQRKRVQVEHTITEEITGIDIVQSQILIASGKTLPELGLTQDAIAEPTMYGEEDACVCNEMMNLMCSNARLEITSCSSTSSNAMPSNYRESCA